MSYSCRMSFTILACFIAHYAYAGETPVVVCNFNVISKNADTGNIISQAVTSAKHILSCFYWSSLLKLPVTIAHMQQRGTEIAKMTPGITNVIKKLFTELEADGYGKFTDTAITCLDEMGVNPVPDQEALSLLRRIKEFRIPTIGIGSQDSTEHAIFTRKMLITHNTAVPTLFDGIVTIPTCDEQERFTALGNPDYLLHNPGNPRWLVSGEPYPFQHATQLLAGSIVRNAKLHLIEDKAQLAYFAHALQRIQQRSPSPLRNTLLGEDKIIEPMTV